MILRRQIPHGQSYALETPPPSDRPLLRVSGLRVNVAATDLPILLGVDLTMGVGDVLCLVGETGCGKSVTALSLLGLLPPGLEVTGGSAIFQDSDLLALSEPDMMIRRGRYIAWIPQDPRASLNPAHTVGTHLMDSVIRHRGLCAGQARTEAARLLDMVHLTDARALLTAYPHELSGGMAQRVAIARALAGAPDLLIADEATTALDVTTQTQILNLLLELRDEQGLSLLFVTHDLGVAAEVADQVVVMYCGKVVESAPVAAFFGGPSHPYAAALLASVPQLEAVSALAPISGVVPSMEALPTGCAFHPRCTQAFAPCKTETPALERVAGRAVACHAISRER